MIRQTGRVTDPIMKGELDHIIKQMNDHLTAITPVQRKYGVTAVGLVNGTNKIFTLPDNFNTSTIKVYLDTTIQFSYTLADKRVIFNTSTSSGWLGRARLSTCAPLLVTRTSSSIRTPMPRYSAGNRRSSG